MNDGWFLHFCMLVVMARYCDTGRKNSNWLDKPTMLRWSVSVDIGPPLIEWDTQQQLRHFNVRSSWYLQFMMKL